MSFQRVGKTYYEIRLEILRELRGQMYGRDVNGTLTAVITGDELDKKIDETENIIKNICNFCPKPCWTEHCCTKKEEKE